MYIRGLILREFRGIGRGSSDCYHAWCQSCLYALFLLKEIVVAFEKSYSLCLFLKKTFVLRYHVSTRATNNRFPIHLRVGTFERHFKKVISP